MQSSRVTLWLILTACCAIGVSVFSKSQQAEGDGPPHAAHQPTKTDSVAGEGELLMHVPKNFAKVVEVDATKRQIRLRGEDENRSRTWTVNPDAEIKVNGWWGRLEQFSQGDRVWVWFDVDRQKEPISILMLADEISEKDIHSKAKPEEIEPLRKKQREYLRAVWRKEGLPGTVSVLHKVSGEMDVLLDHEAIRWGRYLSQGDRVTLTSISPIHATVKHVRPWRERTMIRLVTAQGIDQADLALGQRVQLIVPEPPAEVQNSPLPTDIGRKRSKAERIEWVLASVYCTCQYKGDHCAGMFYSLASCSPRGCANPDKTRGVVAKMIDDDKTDRAIFDHLLRERGPELLKPHLLK